MILSLSNVVVHQCYLKGSILSYIKFCNVMKDQSMTNGPINAHLTIAQVMPKYNHNNEKQEALL